MSQKHLYIRTSTGEWMYWGNKGRTGVALGSRYGCLSSPLRSPHLLQSTLAYTLDLEHLAM